MKIPSWAQNGLMSPEIRLSVVRAKETNKMKYFKAVRESLIDYFFIKI